VGSCSEPGALWLMVLRATTEASHAAGSSAMGSCGESGTRAPHVQAVGSAEASCAVGSMGDSVPMRRPHAWRVPAAGLVEALAGGGLVRGELQRWARCLCVVSSRRARARWRPCLSAAGSVLPKSGRAAQMAWSWGWRHQDLEASVLVRPVLLCSGGDVRPVLVAVRIWGVAPPLVHHPCIGGCWIRRLVVVLAVGLVVVESLSSLGQALFRSFSRQIWQPSRWRCDVSLRWWQWCSMVECFSLQCAMESSL
jgi:hypothetical protein